MKKHHSVFSGREEMAHILRIFGTADRMAALADTLNKVFSAQALKVSACWRAVMGTSLTLNMHTHKYVLTQKLKLNSHDN